MGPEDVEFESEDPDNALFPEEIRTPRLRLTRFSRETVPVRELHDRLAHGDHVEEVTEHLKMTPPSTLRETRELLVQWEGRWEEGEMATYKVGLRDHDRGHFAGLATLRVDWPRRSGELGVLLFKQFWGNGYAGERAEALIELAFEWLELEVVDVSCFTENRRAYRSVEKYLPPLGGEYVGVIPNAEVDSEGVPRDCHRFYLTREDYERD